VILFCCVLRVSPQSHRRPGLARGTVPIDATSFIESEYRHVSHASARHKHHQHHNQYRFQAPVVSLNDNSLPPVEQPYQVNQTNDVSGEHQAWFKKRLAEVEEQRKKYKPAPWNPTLNRPPGTPRNQGGILAAKAAAKELWSKMVGALKDKKHSELLAAAKVKDFEDKIAKHEAGSDTIAEDLLPDAKSKLTEATQALEKCQKTLKKCAANSAGDLNAPTPTPLDKQALEWAKKNAPAENTLYVPVPEAIRETPDEPNEKYDSTFEAMKAGSGDDDL